MLVLVTGGTGFLGAHTVAALVRDGHRVRVLARARNRIPAALGRLGLSSHSVEVVVGDVTERAAVDGAVHGVDAVVHAAAVYSFDARQHAAMRRTNVAGTELVLGAARRFDVGRIVYVSTFGAMLPAPGGVVSTQASPGTAREPYLASKAAAEAVARRHAPALYCEFVDYDEIAHHAGPPGPSRWPRWTASTGCWGRWSSSPPAPRGRTTSSSSPVTGRARARRSSSDTGPRWRPWSGG
jgi:nucleoside-diphosphate-sugar epimerase